MASRTTIAATLLSLCAAASAQAATYEYGTGFASRGTTANSPSRIALPLNGVATPTVPVAIPSINKVVTDAGGTIAATGATVAQMEAAAQAKAKAITDAVNTYALNSNIPKVNGVVATVSGTTKVKVRPYGSPAGTPPVEITVPVVSYTGLDGSPYYTDRGAATMENGDPIPVPKGGGKGGAGGSGGTGGSSGSTQGSATGLNSDGTTSTVGFGIVDGSAPTPNPMFVELTPTVGENDGQVLGELAGLFNQNFGASGFSATYDPASNALMVDQTLPETYFVYSTDDDLGLGGDALGTGYIAAFVPEPGTGALLLGGLLTLGGVRGRSIRGRQRRAGALRSS